MFKLLLQYSELKGPKKPPIVSFLGAVIFIALPILMYINNWAFPVKYEFRNNLEPISMDSNPTAYILFLSIFVMIGIYFLIGGVAGMYKNTKKSNA